MASNEKIDSIIDEKAFQQLERAVTLLVNTQGELVKATQEAKKFNDAIGNSKSVGDYTKAQEDAAKKTEELAKSQEKLTQKNKDVAAQIEATVIASKAKITTTEQEKAVVDRLTGSIDDNIKRQIQLKLELKAVKDEQKQLTSAAAGSVASKQALTQKTAELAKQELELKAAIQQNNLEVRRAIKEQLAAEGSSDALAARLDTLRATYRGLSEAERENEQVGGILLKQITEYDTKLKELDASQGVYNRNVGNYTAATTNLKNALTDLIPGAQGVVQAFDAGKTALESSVEIIKTYINGTQTAKTSTEGLSGAQKAALFSSEALAGGLRILRIALISTGIGAIVVLLGSLIAFLASTQQGIDAVTSVTRPLVAIFQSLLGVAQNLGKTIFEAFSNPKQLLKDLGDLLVSQVINRFKALGVVLEGLIDFDLNKVSNGLFQAVSGVENLTGKISNAAKVSGKFLADAAAKGSEIDRLQKEIEKSQLAFNRNQIKINDLVDEQLLISKDTSRSFAEREKAAQRIIALREAEGQEEAKIIQKQIQKLKIEQSLNDTSRKGNQELIDLEVALDAAQDKGLEARKEQLKVIAGLKKEQAAADKERQKQEDERNKALAISELNLNQSRLQIAIDRNKRVLEDEKLADTDRLSNLQQYLDNQKKLIESNLEEELKAEGLLSNDKIRLREEAQNQIDNLAIEGAALRLKIEQDNLDKLDKARLTANDKEISQIEIQRDTKLLALEKEFQDGLISEEQYQKDRLKIQKEFADLAIQEQLNQVQEEINIQKARGKDTTALEAELAALKIKFSKEATDAQIKDLEKVAEAESKLKELQKELASELFELGVSFGNAQFEREQQKIDKQIEDSEKQADFERQRVEESLLSEEEKAIRLAQIDATAQAKREALERRQRQIQIQQARFQKAADAARIISQTSLAIISALAQVPKFDFGISAGAIAATYGAIGAVQLAQVLATPIPGFYKGTDNSPEGLAYVGEQGAEGRINPDGSFSITPPTKTLTYLEKGTQIIPAPELKQMIAAPNNSFAGAERISMTEVVNAINKSTSETKKAIKNINIPPSTTITKSGWLVTQRKNNGWNEYLKNNLN